MIDAKSVIAGVLGRSYPSNWRVYYGRENSGCFDFWEPAHHCFLVIHSQGIVQWTVGEEEDFGWLSFPDIYRVELAREMEIRGYDGDVGSRTYYWLNIFGNDGTYIKWEIKNCFGDSVSIGNTIIAAYNYFQSNNGFLP